MAPAAHRHLPRPTNWRTGAFLPSPWSCGGSKQAVTGWQRAGESLRTRRERGERDEGCTACNVWGENWLICCLSGSVPLRAEDDPVLQHSWNLSRMCNYITMTQSGLCKRERALKSQLCANSNAYLLKLLLQAELWSRCGDPHLQHGVHISSSPAWGGRERVMMLLLLTLPFLSGEMMNMSCCVVQSGSAAAAAAGSITAALPLTQRGVSWTTEILI